jgi:hypothetical protein
VQKGEKEKKRCLPVSIVVTNFQTQQLYKGRGKEEGRNEGREGG